MTENVIATERLNPSLRPVLSALLDTMIPENQSLSAPSGGIDEVVDDVIATLTGNAVEIVTSMLINLTEHERGSFAELDSNSRWQIFQELEKTNGHEIRILGGILLQCYYRNDAVLRSLGMEARAPFPQGNEVDQGEWHLLDPVKNRGKLYREV